MPPNSAYVRTLRTHLANVNDSLITILVESLARDRYPGRPNSIQSLNLKFFTQTKHNFPRAENILLQRISISVAKETGIVNMLFNSKTFILPNNV